MAFRKKKSNDKTLPDSSASQSQQEEKGLKIKKIMAVIVAAAILAIGGVYCYDKYQPLNKNQNIYAQAEAQKEINLCITYPCDNNDNCNIRYSSWKYRRYRRK